MDDLPELLMTLQEVAAYLDMRYRLVLELVRAGEIPAIKAGGMYRVRRQDAEVLYREQYGPGASPDPAASGAAEMGTLSDRPQPSQPGDTRETTRAARSLAAGRRSPAPLLRCERCLKLIPKPAWAGGWCEAEDCELVICRTCWAGPDGHFCRTHVPLHAQKVAQARERLERGEVPVVVLREEAHLRAVTFMARFKAGLRQVSQVRDPVSGHVFQVPDWEACRQTAEALFVADDALRPGPDAAPPTPHNLRSYYVLEREGVSFTLDARTLSHLDTLQRDGIDTQPMQHQELVALLGQVAGQIRPAAMNCLLILAAPSGWNDEAVRLIVGDAAQCAYRHPGLMVMLVDLAHDELYYDRQDERLHEFVPLLKPRTQPVLPLVRDYVDRMLLVQEGVTLDDVAQTLDLERGDVAAAARHLASTGTYILTAVEGLGEILMKRDSPRP